MNLCIISLLDAVKHGFVHFVKLVDGGVEFSQTSLVLVLRNIHFVLLLLQFLVLDTDVSSIP